MFPSTSPNTSLPASFSLPPAWTNTSLPSMGPASPGQVDVGTASPGQVAVAAVSLGLMGVAAIAGNTLVLIAVTWFRRLRTPANVFVANLAVADGLFGVLLCLLIPNVTAQRNALGDDMCTAWGYLAPMNVVISNNTLAIISISRYYLITQPSKYSRIFNIRNSVVMAITVWPIAGLIVLPTVTGWSEIEFNSKTNACSYARKQSVSFHYFLLSFGFILPLVFVSICYTRIWVIVRRSSRRVKTTVLHVKAAEPDMCHANDNTSHPATIQKKVRWSKEINQTSMTNGNNKPAASSSNKNIKLTKMLACIFLIYVLSWGPYYITNMIDGDAKWSNEIHTFVSWLGFLNCGLNPILYGFMNQQFKDAFCAILCRPCWSNRTTVLHLHEPTVTLKQMNI